MKNSNENLLTLFLYIFSFVFLLLGTITGIIFLLHRPDLGVMMIMFSLFGGVVIFIQAKLNQMYNELKSMIEGKTNIVNDSAPVRKYLNVEEEAASDEEHVDKKISWEINDNEMKSVINLYKQQGQVVETVIPTPFPKYCVVKAEDFIDVIDINNEGIPITLTRSEVEHFSALKLWIEENIFNEE